MNLVDTQSKWHDRYERSFLLRISYHILQIILNATAHINRAVFVLLSYTISSFLIIVMYNTFLGGIQNLLLPSSCRARTLINIKNSVEYYTYSQITECKTQMLPQKAGIFLYSIILFFFLHYKPSEECYMFQTAEVSLLIYWLFMVFISVHCFVLMQYFFCN